MLILKMDTTKEKTEVLHSISALHEAVKSGDMERMLHWADILNTLFENSTPYKSPDHDGNLLRFKIAEALVAFYMAVDKQPQAETTRNRVIAHYQTIRKSKEYTACQKHLHKEILKRIRELIPDTQKKYSTAIDKSTPEYKRAIFTLRARNWFCKAHGMSPSEGWRYLRQFNIDTLTETLPTDMPKARVVEEITRFCHMKGGSLAPRSMQRRYEVGSRPARHLYIIGNGFDLYHGAESGYKKFRRYLYKRSPETIGYFDLYFGPRSLDRSFATPVGWFWCMQPYTYRKKEYGLRYPIATWSRMNLWRDFETNLCELNREKVLDILDMQLPRMNEGEEGFRYADYYRPLDEITNAVTACTFEMKYHFHKWINTLHYAKGYRKKMLDIDKDAIFLNFNYTLFLESEYGIQADRICYIHGNRKDKFGSLVLGHNTADEEVFERWIHKNRNRRRYRAVQKDGKGRYFSNDKLAYLAFFQKNYHTGNWRLPIRYYAVDSAIERLEGYYDANFKNTRKVISAHMGFFDSLGYIEKVTIIGCSLGSVDMDYYRMIRSSVKENAVWEFSYHSPEDRKRIDKFCKELKIDKECVNTFYM